MEEPSFLCTIILMEVEQYGGGMHPILYHYVTDLSRMVVC